MSKRKGGRRPPLFFSLQKRIRDWGSRKLRRGSPKKKEGGFLPPPSLFGHNKNPFLLLPFSSLLLCAFVTPFHSERPSLLLLLLFSWEGLLSPETRTDRPRGQKKDKEEGSLRINNSPPTPKDEEKGLIHLSYATIHHFFRGLEYTFLLLFHFFLSSIFIFLRGLFFLRVSLLSGPNESEI